MEAATALGMREICLQLHAGGFTMWPSNRPAAFTPRATIAMAAVTLCVTSPLPHGAGEHMLLHQSADGRPHEVAKVDDKASCRGTRHAA